MKKVWNPQKVWERRSLPTTTLLAPRISEMFAVASIYM